MFNFGGLTSQDGVDCCGCECCLQLWRTRPAWLLWCGLCVRERDGEKRRKDSEVDKSTWQEFKGLYSSNNHLHMFAQTSLTHIIILFIGLDFDGSHSQAAFISICLDTIYYQLFILVFSPLCLSHCLPICWLLDFQTVTACESVCHPPPPSLCHFPACPQRESLSCLSLHLSVSCVCRSQSRCDSLWAGLGFDHDLLLKPCGRSSPSQTAPTTVDLTLLLAVCSSASSGCAITCMFAEKWDRKQTLSCMHTKIISSCPSSNPVYWVEWCSIWCIGHAAFEIATDPTANAKTDESLSLF